MALSLKISLEGGAITKIIQFDPQIAVFDACKIIRDKFAETIHGQRKFLKFVLLLTFKQRLVSKTKKSR